MNLTQSKPAESAQTATPAPHTPPTPVPPGAPAATSDSQQEQAVELHEDHRTPDTASAEVPAGEPSIQNLRDPNAAPEVQSLGLESEPKDNRVIYSCYPLEKFSLGSAYKFEKGQLKLTPAEAVKFDEILTKVDVRTRNQIKKVDVAAAEAFLANRQPVAKRGAAESVDALTAKATERGTKPIDG